MEAELTEMIGAKIYRRFAALMAERDAMRAQRVPLPHPAVRQKGGAGR
jgi:hypothetical protein